MIADVISVHRELGDHKRSCRVAKAYEQKGGSVQSNKASLPYQEIVQSAVELGMENLPLLSRNDELGQLIINSLDDQGYVIARQEDVKSDARGES